MSGTPSALLNLGVPLRSATPLSATLEPVAIDRLELIRSNMEMILGVIVERFEIWSYLCLTMFL